MLSPLKESYDKPRHHIKNQKHHFADEGLHSQSYSFSSSHVQMWDLDNREDWVPKNWCLWNVVVEMTLESAWDCKEIKPVNLKESNPEYSLEGLILKLRLQYIGHLLWTADLLEKTLMLGNIEDNKGGQQGMRWFHDITDSMDMNLSKLWETVQDRGAWLAAVHGVSKSWAQLSSLTRI